MTLTHNNHKDYYMTVAKAIEEKDYGYTDDCWVDQQQKQKAIDTDECWTIQWYPDTPIGSYILSAADLDVLLEYANRD